QETTGDLRFQRIASGDDAFLSVPNGGLFQVVDGVGVQASSLNLYAVAGVGSSVSPLDIQLNPTGVLKGIVLGPVHIQSEANLTVGGFFWLSSNVNLTAKEGDVNINALGDFAGVVTVTAEAGAITDTYQNPSAAIGAGAADLAATAGGIGDATHPVR